MAVSIRDRARSTVLGLHGWLRKARTVFCNLDWERYCPVMMSNLLPEERLLKRVTQAQISTGGGRWRHEDSQNAQAQPDLYPRMAGERSVTSSGQSS